FDAAALPFGLDVGDLNGDGKLDLAVIGLTASGPAELAVLLGRGDGTFAPPRHFDGPPVTGFVPVVSVRVADFNRDGHADLLAAGGATVNAAVFLGNGDGSFQGGIPAPVSGNGLAVADLNGDGIPDAVTTTIANNSVFYALGNGDGSFGSAQSFTAGQSP